MPGKGRVFTEEHLRQIIKLLSTTEMSIPEIAERMSCSRSAIVSINRKFGIRKYEGRRTSWLQLQEDRRPA